MKGPSLPRFLIALLVILGILLLFLIVRAIFALALEGIWPGDLHSQLFADYSADPDHLRVAPLNPAIIAEAVGDSGEPGAGQEAPDVATIIAALLTPVPSATPPPGAPTQAPSAASPTPAPPPSPPAVSPSPTPRTPTPSPSPQPSPTPSPTAILSPSPTPTPAASPTPWPTSTPVPPPPPPPPPPPTATFTPAPTPSATPTATPTQTPAAPPDLTSSRKAASLVEALPGERVSYQIVVSNTGSLPATSVTVRDTLPTTFTLHVPSIYGPVPGTVSGPLVAWGPFDVPPLSQMTLGFSGTLEHSPAPPRGVRGEWVPNRAEISAPWLSPSIYRNADVLVMYPPQVHVVPGSLNPTVALQNQVVDFQLDVYNDGSASTDLYTSSYLQLQDSSATVDLTTTLLAPVTLPADAVARTLTFEPLHLAGVPTGTCQVNLHLYWLDENGINDEELFSGIGSVTVNSGPTLRPEPTPPPMTTVTGTGTLFYPSFLMWNEGSAGDVHLSSDYVDISATTDWGTFAPYDSYNFKSGFPACIGGSLWVSSTLSAPGIVTAHWAINSATCGDPYVWEPDPLHTFSYYTHFFVEATTPVTPGVYTITVKTSLNNGTIFTEYAVPYNIVP